MTQHDMEFNASDWLPHLPWRGQFYCTIEASWIVEDHSFSYAGTHCTGGMPGTHYCYGVECEEAEIIDEVYDDEDNEIILSATEQKYYSELAMDRIPDREKPYPSEVIDYYKDCDY